MNPVECRRYIACSKGNAVVAAWISILDQHKLPRDTSIPPEEWYQAFEELYTSNAMDPDVFNQCDVKKTFFSGAKVQNKELNEAFWNLTYVRSLNNGEASDNEEFIMEKKYSMVLPDAENMLGEYQPRRALQKSQSPGQLSNPMEPAGLSMLEFPSLDGMNMVEPHRQTALKQERSDIRSLPCRDPEPESFSRPYTETANFAVTCCGDDVFLEDSGGTDFYNDEENDVIDFQLHGSCPRCGTSFHMGASMPIPKGSAGGPY